MPQAALIWLALLLLVLLGLFLVTVRRISVLVARTRDLEQFQRAVAGLEVGLAAIVDPLVTSLDEIRRRAGDPPGLAAGLETTKAALRDLVRQGKALRPPPALAEEAAALLVELDRAARATDLLEHGLDALLAQRGHRELEAQTSLKRAALNLRNARGASVRIADRVAAVRPADLIAQPGGKSPAVQVRVPSSFGPDVPDIDDDGV